MPRIVPIVAVLVAAAVAAVLWAWLGRPTAIVDLPGGRLQCLSYSPASEGASPIEAVDGVYHVPPGLIARRTTSASLKPCSVTMQWMSRVSRSMTRSTSAK